MGSRRDPLERPMSPRSKWYVEHERHLELLHFCRQYPIWKKALSELRFYPASSESDPTGETAIKMEFYESRIAIVEESAKESEASLSKWILINAIDGISFAKLSARYDVPCGKDMFKDRMRKFYWILDKRRK